MCNWNIPGSSFICFRGDHGADHDHDGVQRPRTDAACVLRNSTGLLCYYLLLIRVRCDDRIRCHQLLRQDCGRHKETTAGAGRQEEGERMAAELQYIIYFSLFISVPLDFLSYFLSPFMFLISFNFLSFCFYLLSSVPSSFIPFVLALLFLSIFLLHSILSPVQLCLLYPRFCSHVLYLQAVLDFDVPNGD